MINLPNSVFRHIPKTGGMWVRYVLQDVAIKPFDYNETDHRVTVEAAHAHKPVFTFVRNPWAWYVSMYNYSKNGSYDDALDQNAGTFYRVFDHEPTFAEFLHVMIEPSVEIKRSIQSIERLELMQKRVRGRALGKAQVKSDPLEIASLWVKSDKSLYQCTLDAYTTDAAMVGSMENISADLVNMLTQTMDITDTALERIQSTPARNVGQQVDYRSYYTTELQNLVHQDSRALIEKFGYQF